LTPIASNNSSAPRSHPIRGYLFIAAAAAFWAASATLGKAVFTGRLIAGADNLSPLDPLILSQTRTTISFLVLAPLLLARGGSPALRMPPSHLLQCMLLGAVGITGSNFFYYFAIEKTTVATAIILQYTAPVWVLLYMVARRLQRPTLERTAAVGMAVAGSSLAIGLFGESQIRLNVMGVAAALGAAASFAFYNVYGHHLLELYDRWKVVAYALLGSAVFWIVVNPPWKIVAARYSAEQWYFLIGFAFVSMLVPFSFYFAGLQYLDATRAIVTSCLEPVFAILIAMIFVGETVAGMQALGMAIVLVATIVVQFPERTATKSAAAGAFER